MLSAAEKKRLRSKIIFTFSEEHRREIGEKLKLARKKAKLTQQDVADILYYNDKRQIGRYEAGESFSFEVICQMIQLYGCTLSDIVPDELKPYINEQNNLMAMMPSVLLASLAQEISKEIERR